MANPTRELDDMLKELDLSNEVLAKYRDVFIDEIKLGLNKDTVDKSSLKCYLTYVQDLPDENVKGKFLALDLGGTNFRVLCIKLAKTYLDMRSKKYQIPKSLMQGSGEQLFDHIAECLHGFTLEHKINNDNLPLGFTFSFPCEQRGLEVGILKQWTKGFSCSGVEGENVVELLREAIKRKKDLVIDVVAVLNDTTGTLMSCAWKKTNTKIGLIIGTGTNACYVEKVENVAKFDGDKSKPTVLINTESGAFGGGGQVDFVRTKWDRELDAESNNPGVNIMEKMISGMYLGEFVRRVLLSAVERHFIFDGVATEKLKKMGSFKTEYVSDIEGDLPGQHDNARNVLGSLGYGTPSEQDCVDLHYTCFVAWQRAGRMVSAGMAALLNHMQYDDVTIGVDGSLYRYHPGFADLMDKKIRELTDTNIKFKCILAEDGSGRGAALVAAAARKTKQRGANRRASDAPGDRAGAGVGDLMASGGNPIGSSGIPRDGGPGPDQHNDTDKPNNHKDYDKMDKEMDASEGTGDKGGAFKDDEDGDKERDKKRKTDHMKDDKDEDEKDKKKYDGKEDNRNDEKKDDNPELKAKVLMLDDQEEPDKNDKKNDKDDDKKHNKKYDGSEDNRSDEKKDDNPELEAKILMLDDQEEPDKNDKKNDKDDDKRDKKMGDVKENDRNDEKKAKNQELEPQVLMQEHQEMADRRE